MAPSVSFPACASPAAALEQSPASESTTMESSGSTLESNRIALERNTPNVASANFHVTTKSLSPYPSQKPLLLFASFPAEGHTNPLLAIAASMVRRGYEVAYLCSAAFEQKIKSAGAEFFALDWGEDRSRFWDIISTLASMPIGARRLALELVVIFYDSMPDRAKGLAAALETLRARDPHRQIICVEDVFNMSTMPLHYGGPLPAGFDKPPKTLGISPVPLMMQSQDKGPFIMGLPPDSTKSGRLRNKALNQMVNEGPNKPLMEAWGKALAACSCTTVPSGDPMSAWFTAHDACVMLCSPSLEYPVSDLPNTIHFTGCLPKGDESSSFRVPAWWPEISQNSSEKGAGKRVIFVSQGTINRNWAELILPTMEALKGREDVLVVAALGYAGASLDVCIDVPANARVIDYLPYDAILPRAHVFVSNAGYGAFRHAVISGVPAVFAGETEDKLEVAMRAEWAGFAVNLRTQTPSADQVRIGVTRVLGDGRYAARAAELRAENEALDCLSQVEKLVELLTE